MSTKTTKSKSVVCSYCGGQIDVNALDENVECPFCGTYYAVSDLLNESDAVRIEKIKTNAQQKMEQEKFKREVEQNEKQEEKDEVKKFKKSIFSKVILVLFAISVMFFFVAKGYAVKAVIIAQAVLFLVAWLMGMNIIKSPKRGIHTIVAIIAMVLFIPIVSMGPGRAPKKSEEIVWADIAMNEVLPEPEGDEGRILANRDDWLSVDIYDSSQEEYDEYVDACIKKGFTVDAEKDTDSYEAYNADGYELRLFYDDRDEEYSISLKAPIEMKENAWISTPLSQKVPEPKSKVGKVDSNSETYFSYYAGDTSKEDFAAYAEAVLKAGFSTDYDSDEDYFHGKDSDGNRVELFYQGNNTMEIRITSPKDDSYKLYEPDYDPDSESDSDSDEEKSSDGAGISSDFKEAMDSYEDFVDEYVSFMKKYKDSDGTDMSIISDYTDYVDKLADASEKFEKWDEDEMSDEELAYYEKVQERTAEKLASVY